MYNYCTNTNCNASLRINEIKDITRSSRVEFLKCSDCGKSLQRTINKERKINKNGVYRYIFNPLSYLLEVLKVTLIMIPATACFGLVVFVYLYFVNFFEVNSISDFALITAVICIIVSFVLAIKVVND